MNNKIENKTNSHQLRIAAANGNYAEVDKLLTLHEKTGEIRINERSSNGNTALIWAMVKRAELQAISPKHEKIKDYDKIIIKLIRSGADDTLKNNFGISAYSYFLNSSIASLTSDSVSLLLLYEMSKAAFENEIKNLENKTTHSAIYAKYFVQLILLKASDYVKNLHKPKILSLGSGLCLDALAIIKYMQLFNKEVEYVGVDTDENLIALCSSLFADKPIKLFFADATDVKHLKQKLPHTKFDFGLLTNGDFSSTFINGREKIFKAMVDETFPELLTNDAPLLLTFGAQTEIQCFSKSECMRKNYYYKSENNNFSTLEGHVKISFTGVSNTNVTQPNTFAVILRYDETIYNVDQQQLLGKNNLQLNFS